MGSDDEIKKRTVCTATQKTCLYGCFRIFFTQAYQIQAIGLCYTENQEPVKMKFQYADLDGKRRLTQLQLESNRSYIYAIGRSLHRVSISINCNSPKFNEIKSVQIFITKNTLGEARWVMKNLKMPIILTRNIPFGERAAV